MKKIIVAILICILFFTTPIYASSSDTSQFDVPSEWSKIFDEAPVSQNDWNALSFHKLFDNLIKSIKTQMLKPVYIFIRIAVLMIFAALAKGLCPENSINNIGNTLDNIITLAVFSICSVPILEIIENMIAALETNKNYLSAFVPVFSSVLVSCGQIGSAAVYSGFFFSTVMLIANILCSFALPALRVFFALCVMDGVCKIFDFSRITAICVKISRWLLMICATIFVAIMGLQSVFADAADTVALKTGKLILSASVPVIGRAVSDAISGVYSGLKMLKGTAGIALVGTLAVSFIPLLIEAAIYYLVLNLAAMISSATGNDGSTKLFSGLAEGISLSMLFIFFFAVMSVLSTVMMILIGGGA